MGEDMLVVYGVGEESHSSGLPATEILEIKLGIPTANIPPAGLDAYPDLSTGIYFGYTSLQHPGSLAVEVYPSVLSIGYNPFYNNTTRSIEIHILHKFDTDFYGARLNLLMLGFIRPEYDYVSKESLIEDILTDCQVADRSLKREHWQLAREPEWEQWLKDFKWATGLTERKIEEVEGTVLGKTERE